MRVVEVAVNKVVNVIAMRHRLVSAARSVNMTRLVARTCVLRGADIGILFRDLDHMLVNVIAVHVMQVTVVQIIDMIGMLHGRMTAPRTMLVVVLCMMGQLAIRH